MLKNEVCIHKAIVLTACRDRSGFFRFFSTLQDTPGFWLDIESCQDKGDIIHTIKESASSNIGLSLDKVKFNFVDGIEPTIELGGNRQGLLFLVEINKDSFEAPESWPTLPDLLRKMPKSKNRVAYLKVMQVLSGSLSSP